MNLSKKNQFKNYLRIFTLLLGVSVLLWNCEKEEVIINDTVEQITSKTKYSSKMVSAIEIPNIIDFVNNKTNNIFKKTSKSKTNYGDLDLEEILAIADSLGNTNYTFKIKNIEKIDDYSFYNLIVKEDKQGNTISTPYIIKYTMEENFAIDYLNKENDMGEFTGSISRFNLSSYTKSISRKGGNDPIGDPCNQSDFTGGDSSGGTNNGSGSDSSGGGGHWEVVCIGNPRTWTCSWALVWVYTQSRPQNKLSNNGPCDLFDGEGGAGVNPSDGVRSYPGREDGFPYEWWKDENFINNERLFNQDPYDVWKQITQKEKDLIKSFPTEAYQIYKNRVIAENATKTKFGRNGLNDKSDAFRHAYYNAINTKKVGAYMAELFSNAHESEVPVQLTLEKQMDIFNNDIGHHSGINYPQLSISELVNRIYQEVLDGNLRYLSPLDFATSPFYDANGDGVRDCSKCSNGIISSTILTPSNQ